jgi:acyl-CoA synthetase (AMP-forming)/AMP-acid ligase II
VAHFTGPSYPTPDYPPTFWSLVERAAEALDDCVVLTDDYGRALTASGLRDSALRAAAWLRGLGIGPGSTVSWQLPTTLEAMVVMVALTRLGAVQNPIIPILREAEVGFIAGQVGSSHLLVPEKWNGFAHGDLARELAARHGLEAVIVDHATDPASTGGALRLPDGAGTALPPVPADGSEVRWLYFSSGTTAAPKGARHSDRSVLASASGIIGQLGAGAGDINPLAFPISHIGGITMLTASLLTGMRLVLFDTFDPATTGERMAAHHVTLLGSAVPFFLVYMAAQQRHGTEPLYPHLRACVGGGAPVPVEVNRAVRATFGVSGVANAWGLTEFPVAASPKPSDPPEWLDQTVGQPVPGVTVRVVAEDGAELDRDEEGELRLKGPQCFAGYLDPSLDADAFDEEGWFRTGDLGLVDGDGNVRITGRIKDLIIRNAENISAGEIEAALLPHERIADVAVIGVPDARTGERVCAVVVLAGDGTLTLEEVARHCAALGLARQKTPERIEIVDVLPRNSLGKVLKNELRSRFGVSA